MAAAQKARRRASTTETVASSTPQPRSGLDASACSGGAGRVSWLGCGCRTSGRGPGLASMQVLWGSRDDTAQGVREKTASRGARGPCHRDTPTLHSQTAAEGVPAGSHQNQQNQSGPQAELDLTAIYNSTAGNASHQTMASGVITSLQGKQWGKNENTDKLYFLVLQNYCGQ